MKSISSFNRLFVFTLLLCPFAGLSYATIDLDGGYLSDLCATAQLQSRQQWGLLGMDSAAGAPDGRPHSPMRIGEEIYAKGLGHHANGEITIQLNGDYLTFESSVGVQWQGGGKGSVIFQIFVDGAKAFDSGKMTDSDSAKPVCVPLKNARELKLVSNDAGDGIACDMANWAGARLIRDPRKPHFAPVFFTFNGALSPKPSLAVCGLSLIAQSDGPQVAILEAARQLMTCVKNDESVDVVIPIQFSNESIAITAEAVLEYGKSAELCLTFGDENVYKTIRPGEPVELSVSSNKESEEKQIILRTKAGQDESRVCWRSLRYCIGDNQFDIPLQFETTQETLPLPELPVLRPSIEQVLIEWDWRMQDGIGTLRNPSDWPIAIERTLQRGDKLIHDLTDEGLSLDPQITEWDELRNEWKRLAAPNQDEEARWEDLWRRVHQLRRQIVFCNPLAKTGPILFVKQAPGNFSHQLTQYYGTHSRPGGGIYVLDRPGESMQCRSLTNEHFPLGSFQFVDVSFEGKRILFAYCPVDKDYANLPRTFDRFYHVYETNADGTETRQLTDGPYDDFAPRYLPNGKIVFTSTRRGGFHRCGRGPCPVYTLCLAESDGSGIRVISFHETHEWDPSVLNDGRVIYTRWDYVDRHAVHYQQLWSVRPDGSDVRIFYGNNTLNPVGVWEAKSVPDSDKVMATAGAHHAMTAGSIILLDVNRGIDGLDPITRLTPDALFPESETPVFQWYAPVGVKTPPAIPPEEERWPGHCYRSPHPLSEHYFLAAYSYDALIGEPTVNHANMFGLYIVDSFGNKELLYRDMNIASLWPVPLRPRNRPHIIPSTLDETAGNEGTFFLQNVYQSWPSLPEGVKIEQLRILQVLPKSTPHINEPMVGLANASPGKQVLGTIPVEADGSAFFRAPAGIPLSFQALDERGMAVQIMRSLTYLQPGENESCIGCHEHRSSVPVQQRSTLALARQPSEIQAGPNGSNPFSYPILVQPVLDNHCVRCHSEDHSEKNILLTGKPVDRYTASYLALAPRVPFSAWGLPNFLISNSEPLTRPDHFGARGSQLMSMLLAGHHGVELSRNDIERLVTWMDTNALFYGTFNPEDQKRQQLGQRIAGPEIE